MSLCSLKYDVSKDDIRGVSFGHKGGRNTAKVIVRVPGKNHPETRHLREDRNGIWRDANQKSYEL